MNERYDGGRVVNLEVCTTKASKQAKCENKKQKTQMQTQRQTSSK
jgi:hypothetical protein